MLSVMVFMVMLCCCGVCVLLEDDVFGNMMEKVVSDVVSVVMSVVVIGVNMGVLIC